MKRSIWRQTLCVFGALVCLVCALLLLFWTYDLIISFTQFLDSQTLITELAHFGTLWSALFSVCAGMVVFFLRAVRPNNLKEKAMTMLLSFARCSLLVNTFFSALWYVLPWITDSFEFEVLLPVIAVLLIIRFITMCFICFFKRPIATGFLPRLIVLGAALFAFVAYVAQTIYNGGSNPYVSSVEHAVIHALTYLVVPTFVPLICDSLPQLFASEPRLSAAHKPKSADETSDTNA